MKINNLSLTNFRNYLRSKLEFGQVNVFVGPNASGKTNLLEAIYFLSQADSPRVHYQKDLVKFDENFSRLEALVNNSRSLNLSVNLKLEKKGIFDTQLRINKKLQKTNRFVGQLKVVSFLPSEISLIDSSPAQKRLYFNNTLTQIQPLYYQKLIRLNKIIYNRNRLLEAINIGKSKEKELLFWDQELINYSVSIFLYRKQVISFINQIIERIYKNLVMTSNNLSITYQSFLSEKEHLNKKDIIKKYKEELSKLRREEIKQGCSLLGPHRDDFIFKINDRSLASFGSRGEFREAILALKLSEGRLIEKITQNRPILLFDDLASELDEQQKAYLFKFLEKYITNDGQIFITTTSLKTIAPELLKKAKVFQINKGKICLSG